MKCGLLGQHLGHSYSPLIHALLGNDDYTLLEREPNELDDFLHNGDFSGLNVTIPYKKTVIPYMDELTPIAKKLGAVNTIVRRPNGSLLGHNSDYFGFASMLQRTGYSVVGKKALVLGSGGASATAVTVLREKGATVIVVSRQGENNYSNLHLHRDAKLIVNATPVGMFPNYGVSPIDLSLFPNLECVLDMIYNPARTQLLLDAEKRRLLTANGLWMLVAQAAESFFYFSGTPIDSVKIESIYQTIRRSTENILLIGMPGCGKSTIGAQLAQRLERPFIDIDAQIEIAACKSIPDIFRQDGEDAFRRMETNVLNHFCKGCGLVIATGGGCVTRVENEPLLRQNSRIFYLRRDISKLTTDGRPLSVDLDRLYAQRSNLYESLADHAIDNNGEIQETVTQILEMIL